MKGRLLPLILALCLLLGGCGWLNGSFVSVTPHVAPRQVSHSGTITAANYKEFVTALKQLVSAGTEVAAIHVSEYPAKALETGVQRAVYDVKHNDPIGAYAVEDIQYEIGSSSGLLHLLQNHCRNLLRSIFTVTNLNLWITVIIHNSIWNALCFLAALVIGLTHETLD